MARHHLDFFSQCGEVKENISFSTLTTMRIGGTARYVITPRSAVSLQLLIAYCRAHELPVKVLGNGSNIIASSERFEGVVIRLLHVFDDVVYGDGFVVAEAGASLINLAYECARKGLSCLEWAGGIPGSVGGALFMNAGSYQHSMSEIVESVFVFNGSSFVWISRDECEYGYRESIFKRQPDWIILAVRLKTQEQDSESLLAIMKERQQRRMQSQPLNYPSSGSCFRNPEAMDAWRCIEEAGLRGFQLGGVKVSDKHANFIVNVDDGSAEDIYQLIEKIQSSVKEMVEVELCLEIEMFNWKK